MIPERRWSLGVRPSVIDLAALATMLSIRSNCFVSFQTVNNNEKRYL